MSTTEQDIAAARADVARAQQDLAGARTDLAAAEHRLGADKQALQEGYGVGTAADGRALADRLEKELAAEVTKVRELLAASRGEQ
jgi:outer membrane protein TolC